MSKTFEVRWSYCQFGLTRIASALSQAAKTLCRMLLRNNNVTCIYYCCFQVECEYES